MKIEATIIDLKYDVFQVSKIVQGIKSNEESSYKEPEYFGGRGTFRKGYPESVQSLLLYLKVKGRPHVKIDVLSQVLEINKRKKITQPFLGKLRDKLLGKHITIQSAGDDERYALDDLSALSVL